MANFELMNQRLDALEKALEKRPSAQLVGEMIIKLTDLQEEVQRLSRKMASNKARLTILEKSGKKTGKKR